MSDRGTNRQRWWRGAKNRLFLGVCIGATSVSVIALAILLTAIGVRGHEHLLGIDRDARDDARLPQPPDVLEDLGAVDWSAAATALGRPELATLAGVDWAAVGLEQDLMYADEIEDVDWSALASTPGIEGAAALAGVDWGEALDALRMPGQGWLGATVSQSDLVQFVTSPPSRRPEKAGLGPALWGSIWICAVCGLVALPLGVGTAVFLEEYKPKHRVVRALHAFVQLNITNLAGVPSIVYGIIGLTAFVQMFGLLGNPNEPTLTIGTLESWYYFQLPFGRGVLAGGLTLMLVILPIVIISSQEGFRAVPDSLRQGTLAMGATRWQMIRGMTLPAAIPGIMTGAILAMSRAIGEAAPVLIICGIVFIRFTPQHVMDEFTAMPLQIFDWAGRPQEAFHAVAASGIVILLAALLTFNAAAIVVRQKFQRPLQ